MGKLDSAARALIACAAVLVGHAAYADELPQPTGEVILTVTGAITNTNQDGAAVFDLAMLQALGADTIATATIWTDGTQNMTGVALDDLLAAVGATGSNLRATAINDYSVDIPVSDAVDGGPIVAYFNNGEPMHVRDKGPLWVIYPWDDKPDYKTEVFYSRSIWQLDRIEVTD